MLQPSHRKEPLYQVEGYYILRQRVQVKGVRCFRETDWFSFPQSVANLNGYKCSNIAIRVYHIQRVRFVNCLEMVSAESFHRFHIKFVFIESRIQIRKQRCDTYLAESSYRYYSFGCLLICGYNKRKR
jgi:hypothetical protein